MLDVKLSVQIGKRNSQEVPEHANRQHAVRETSGSIFSGIVKPGLRERLHHVASKRTRAEQ